ncbi:hypothetical protein BT93_J1397 [Corymbia citriodora subsp. variegata]|nr:hypothetical protein BT93_J1397 [Corymbia citriodora subsp. variegata]
MLVEENREDKPCLFYDPSVLRATEKSLHEVIVLSEKHPALPNPTSMFVCQNAPSTNVLFPRTGRDCGNSNGPSNIGCTDNSRGKQTLADNQENRGSTFLVSPSSDYFYQSTDLPALRPSSNRPKGLADYVNKILASPTSEFPVHYDSLRASQCTGGLEEACKFLSWDRACTDATDSGNLSVAMDKRGLEDGIDEKEQQQGPFNGVRGRKNHGREELYGREGKLNKQSAVLTEEIEVSEMFDRILLCEEEPEPFTSTDGKTSDAAVKNLSLVAHTCCSSSHKNRAKKVKNSEDTVDLRNLLILCAEAISAGDSRNAGDLLKQIRLHSSPMGDACQRVAHAFADALDARLAGTAVENMSKYMCMKRTPICEILKIYQTHYKACPFNKIAIAFANNMIFKVAETAETLHVIDFGILLGFQWPLLIQLLSRRPGGPPKLRLTGIELPEHGFNPEERTVEAGYYLAKYCEQFGVPFEYNPIVLQHWETIKVEELKIGRNEVLAVNCLYRFKCLLDETVVVNNPRDAVLKLIREMRPDIFVLSVVNGTFNSPFFIPRFRQALFHYSALYDMFDCNVSCNNINRLLIERQLYGRQVTNVVACEGLERVERPETYKQWHTRISKAGFKHCPVDKALMKIYIDKLQAYHKDLVILKDGNWMLQGWKGRMLYASSSWKPA